MRYAIKDFYNDSTIVHAIVDNAIERNNHINKVSEEMEIVACVFRPIYKSGEYGKSVVVTFNPLIVHHEGKIYDLFDNRWRRRFYMEYCHYDYDYEEHDCLDYMKCEECPYYYADLD